MKNAMITLAAALLGCILLAGSVWAGDEWRMELRIAVENARTRLVVGQHPEATDGVDGRWEIPALLSGRIQAFIARRGEGRYWQDLAAVCEESPCARRWYIVVDAQAVGRTVTLTWDPAALPAGARVFLYDASTGTITKMHETGSYSYENAGRRGFALEVRR
jgi:hypothetical protein